MMGNPTKTINTACTGWQKKEMWLKNYSQKRKSIHKKGCCCRLSSCSSSGLACNHCLAIHLGQGTRWKIREPREQQKGMSNLGPIRYLHILALNQLVSFITIHLFILVFLLLPKEEQDENLIALAFLLSSS